MPEEISEIFINAAKYRAIKEQESALVALIALIHDIGSEGMLGGGKTPDGNSFVYINDVGISSDTGRGNLTGHGTTQPEAMSHLLDCLLTPEEQIMGGSASSARLTVGDTFSSEPKKTVKVLKSVP